MVAPFCAKCGGCKALMVRCVDFDTSPEHYHLATTKDHDHMHSVETNQQHICVGCLWKLIAKEMMEGT
jgi:hypothetical protein